MLRRRTDLKGAGGTFVLRRQTGSTGSTVVLRQMYRLNGLRVAQGCADDVVGGEGTASQGAGDLGPAEAPPIADRDLPYTRQSRLCRSPPRQRLRRGHSPDVHRKVLERGRRPPRWHARAHTIVRSGAGGAPPACRGPLSASHHARVWDHTEHDLGYLAGQGGRRGGLRPRAGAR